MSYTRDYHEKIVVSGVVSDYVSYPKSENGGTIRVELHYKEDVDVYTNIHVDTNSFDNSIHGCNSTVDTLTGAVVATETAQVVSINENSHKIANTIIGGFFSYIRSEISQQISELMQTADAELMHMKELAQACLNKKKQMTVDYTRISSRYIKIFEDLNHELANRIFEIDKPTFTFKKETDNQQIRTSGNDMVNTIAIFGKENAELHAKISTSIAKKRALDTLAKVKVFLVEQKKLNGTIQQSQMNECIDAVIYLPVCFIETRNKDSQIDKRLFSAPYMAGLQEGSHYNWMVENFASPSHRWQAMPGERVDSIRNYFQAEINSAYPQADAHNGRVREMIHKIANIESIQVV